jgi:hypothetical protein
MARNSVLTPMMAVKGHTAQHLEKIAHVARVRDQHRLRTLAEEGQRAGKRKHVVHGQRQDQGLPALVQVG